MQPRSLFHPLLCSARATGIRRTESSDRIQRVLATGDGDLFSQAVGGTGSSLHDVQASNSDDPSWNFFMVGGDAYKSETVVAGDQRSGCWAGYRAWAGVKEVQKIWENSSLKSSAGIAIDYQRGVLYADDRRCSGDECQLFLVALELKTGQELTRVEVASLARFAFNATTAIALNRVRG